MSHLPRHLLTMKISTYLAMVPSHLDVVLAVGHLAGCGACKFVLVLTGSYILLVMVFTRILIVVLTRVHVLARAHVWGGAHMCLPPHISLCDAHWGHNPLVVLIPNLVSLGSGITYRLWYEESQNAELPGSYWVHIVAPRKELVTLYLQESA